MRKRQRLIDACISALHLYGPSRTTVEKVVAIAKLSPGIVRFYFESKDAMLVASLAYLAAEFEERVLGEVSRLKHAPARALERLVELYLDPEIASPRKVSVWYSFWGEASSRQEYLQICGKKDEDFAALVRELIDGLMAEAGLHHLDADAISLGLIGVLEVLWQTFAFQDEADIDRAAARRRTLAYLASVFPGVFAADTRLQPVVAATEVRGTVPGGVGARRDEDEGALPPWAYRCAALFELEREHLFRPAWQVAGLDSQLKRSGDFLTASWPWERVLLVRAADGHLSALRNACGRQPHALLEAPAGHVEQTLRCVAHGLVYDLSGALVQGATRGDLTPLDLTQVGPLLLVRSPQSHGRVGSPPAVPVQDWPELQVGRSEVLSVAADWKLLVEQWLEHDRADWHFLPPNQLIDLSAEGPRLLQVVPEAPGRARLVCVALRAARARRAQRTASSPDLGAEIALAESTQRGLDALPVEREDAGPVSPTLRRFRAEIAMLLPRVASVSIVTR